MCRAYPGSERSESTDPDQVAKCDSGATCQMWTDQCTKGRNQLNLSYRTLRGPKPNPQGRDSNLILLQTSVHIWKSTPQWHLATWPRPVGFAVKHPGTLVSWPYSSQYDKPSSIFWINHQEIRFNLCSAGVEVQCCLFWHSFSLIGHSMSWWMVVVANGLTWFQGCLREVFWTRSCSYCTLQSFSL